MAARSASVPNRGRTSEYYLLAPTDKTISEGRVNVADTYYRIHKDEFDEIAPAIDITGDLNTVSGDIELGDQIELNLIHIVDTCQYSATRDAIMLYITHMAKAPDYNLNEDNCLELCLSVFLLYFPDLRTQMDAELRKARNYIINLVSVQEWHENLFMDEVGIGEFLVDATFVSQDNAKSQTVLGLICLLIGKRVMEVSREGWFENRIRGLMNSLGKLETDAKGELIFSYNFSIKSYISLSSMKTLRKYLFMKMYNVSRANNFLSSCMKTVCTLLQGCEMTNFILIYNYILRTNIVLFYWHEVNIHRLDILKALNVFKSYGPMKMYIKLVGSEEHMKVFHTSGIVRIAHVARHIAVTSGASTLLNFQGTDREGDRVLVENCMRFLKLTSVAVTKDAQQVRQELYPSNETNNMVFRSIPLIKGDNMVTGDHIVSNLNQYVSHVISNDERTEEIREEEKL